MLSLIVLSLLLRQLPPSLELPAKDVDSILTFSQTVGAPAFASASTQPHLLNQAEGMYGHAAAARPRMARSLEEAGRRHGVLSNMHEKLGEAVRIYERLLDRRLNEGAEPSYPYQQPNQYNHSPYPQHPQYHPQQQQQQHYSQYSQPPPTSAPQAQSPLQQSRQTPIQTSILHFKADIHLNKSITNSIINTKSLEPLQLKALRPTTLPPHLSRRINSTTNMRHNSINIQISMLSTVLLLQSSNPIKIRLLPLLLQLEFQSME